MRTWAVFEAMMARAFIRRMYQLLALSFLLGFTLGAGLLVLMR